MANPVPQVHEGVVDGIPTFWVETPPPLTAVLAFRVGVWDESLLERGIGHLVEHLALYAMRGVEFPYNGQIDGSTMLVVATGTEEDACSFFREFCKQVRSLPVERLETEAKILKVEAEQRPFIFHDQLLGFLFGPNGPGVQHEPERGLDVLSGAEIQAWADRHCVRENAVLLLDGKPPRTLGIDLPAGVYAPRPLPGEDVGYRPDRLELVGHQERGICLGMLCPRSTETVMSLEILQRRFTERLRHQLGLAYTVEPAYTPLDNDTAYVYAGLDASAERADETARAFLGVIRDLRANPPSEEEVARSKRMGFNTTQQDEATVARGEMQRVAWARLLGHTAYSWEELMAERDAATAASIHEAWCDVSSRGLVLAPDCDGLALPDRRKRMSQPVEGARFKPRWWTRRAVSQLIAGPDGVSCEADARWVTLRWDEIVLADRTAPEAWTLYSRTGAWLTLELKGWRRRRKLAKLLGRWVPPAVHWPQPRHA